MKQLLFYGFVFVLGISPLSVANSPSTPLAQMVGSQRAANYEEALTIAKETKRDIVVFQRGSDWNHLAEALYKSCGKKGNFYALGPGFVLVAVDKPELVGGRAVQGQCTAVQCFITGFSDTEVGSSAPLKLAKVASSTPPSNEIVEIQSEGKVAFQRREDGALVA